MVVTSTCANSKVLSMLRSLTICCNEPPNVIVDPMATLRPSVPHLFLELVSAKCAHIGKGDVVWVRMMYCVGVNVKERSSGLNWETLLVIITYGLVCISISSSKGMSLLRWVPSDGSSRECLLTYLINISNESIIRNFEVWCQIVNGAGILKRGDLNRFELFSFSHIYSE